jgi:hypothetical protein
MLHSPNAILITVETCVFSNCALLLAPNDFFSAGKYLLADSAFSNRATMVPAFKKLGNTIELPQEKKNFNTLLASVRVLSEHTIGIFGRVDSLGCGQFQFKL